MCEVHTALVGEDLSSIAAGQADCGWIWIFRGQVPSYRFSADQVGPDLSGKAVAWAMEVDHDVAYGSAFKTKAPLPFRAAGLIFFHQTSITYVMEYPSEKL